MNYPLKIQQLNSELFHMKHSQELYQSDQSDLQVVKIWLGHFLRMFHVWQLRIKLLKFQWRIHFALSFTMGADLFFWNKYWLVNRSQFDLLSCLVLFEQKCSMQQMLSGYSKGWTGCKTHLYVNTCHCICIPLKAEAAEGINKAALEGTLLCYSCSNDYTLAESTAAE